MCFHPNRATASRRRRSLRRRQAPTLPPLALLDLSKPGERQAHEFLVRATSGRERIWEVIKLCRTEDVLLCVVRWTHPDDAVRPYSLAEVNLAEIAVCWREYSTHRDALAALGRGSAAK